MVATRRALHVRRLFRPALAALGDVDLGEADLPWAAVYEDGDGVAVDHADDLASGTVSA
jgi:hypothetical protein